MDRTVLRIVAVGLAGLLLLLSGLIYPATVPHAAHHGHHQAATHGTALCSWLCATGQMATADVLLLSVALSLVALVNQTGDEAASAFFLPVPPSRGPPRSFLSA